MQPTKQFNNSRIRRRPSSRLADNAGEIPQFDLQRKIIQLQSSITTLRTNMQLKLSKPQDANIQLRSQLDKEMNNYRHLEMRMTQAQNSIAGIRENNRNFNEVDYAAMRELESKIMMLEYKVKTSQKALQPLALPSIEMAESRENREVKVLKDIVNQEIKMREQREQFLNKQYDELFQKVLKIERASYEQKQSILPLTPYKTDNSLDLNYLKDAIEGISSKVSSESIARDRKEHSMKQYIDSMIASVRQELLNQSKTIIQGQTDTAKEINESLQALYSTINEQRDSFNKDLETTQSLVSQNIKVLSKRIQVIKDKMVRPSSSEPVSEPSEDLKSKIVHSIQMIQQRIVDIQSSKKGVSSQSQKKTNTMINQLTTNVDEFQQSLNIWTKEMQNKNISIFKQISTSLKNMKIQLASAKKQFNTKLSQTDTKITSISEETDRLKQQSVALKAQIKEQSVKHMNQIRQIRDFVDAGKMQLQKLITESLRDMENRNLKHNHYVSEKLQEMNSKFQESIFQEVEKLTKKISKEVGHLNDVLTQRDKRINNQIGIISQALKYNQIRMQGQVSDLQQKSMESYLKLKTDLVQLQTHQAKLRQKQSERMQVTIKTLNESLNKRIDFVNQGTKKAIEMSALKDKTQLTELIEKNRDECLKAIGTLKYDFTNDIYIRIQDQRSEREKGQAHLRSNQQLLREQIDSKLDQYQKEICKIQLMNSLLQKQEGQYKSQLKGIEQNMKILEQQSVYLKEELGKFEGDIDELIEEIDKLDQKLTKQVQTGMEKLSNQIYVDSLFAKTQFSQHNKTISQLIKITEELVENKDKDSDTQNQDN